MTDRHDDSRPAAADLPEPPGVIHAAAFPLTAGVTVAGARALLTQDTFSRDQVAYLLGLAFWSGTRVRTLADAAELAAAAEANLEPRPTREARVAQRMAEMERTDEILRLRRAGRPRKAWEAEQPRGLMTHDRYGRPVKPRVVAAGQRTDPDCEWPEVAAPGSGRPKW